MYMTFDLGGTSVKYALLNSDADLLEEDRFQTPADNLEMLMNKISTHVQRYKNKYKIAGIGVSAPGAVREDGVIEGSSAIPCTVGQNIKTLIYHQTQLPVSVENDANCAALAEVWKGVLQHVDDAAVIVSGTGIGGALIHNGNIHKGSHLHGGEFGYMILDADPVQDEVQTWSAIGSTGAIVRKVAKQKQWSPKNLSGQQVFELSERGDTICRQAIDRFYYVMALGIFNVQYMYDPDVIAIGGAISARPDLVSLVYEKLNLIMEKHHDATVTPRLVGCRFQNRSNLIGALYHHYVMYGKDV